MADQVLARAIIEVGAKGIADAKAQVAALEAKLHRLEAAYTSGKIGVTRYLEVSQRLRGQIDALSGGVAMAEAAIKKYGSSMAASTAMAAQAGKQFQQTGMSGAMGLMLLSQAIDDVQYGFRAIVNNIPQMGMAIGGAFGMSAEAGMKLGAIAGIAAVAINLIISHWDQLFERFGYGTDTMKLTWQILFGETKDVATGAIGAIEARIKELEAKPIKMAVDMVELDQAKKKLDELKEAKEAWEQMGKGRGIYEKESGEKISGLFGGMSRAELEKLRNDMVNARAEKANANSPAILNQHLTAAEEEKIRMSVRRSSTTFSEDRGPNGEPMGMTEDPEAEAKAIAAERERRRQEALKAKEANKKQAELDIGGMVANAGTDPVAIKNLAKTLRDAKRGDLANRVEDSAPAKRDPKFATDQEERDQEALEVKGREYGRAYRNRQRERAKGTAGQLENDLGGELLANMRMSDADLQKKVREAMGRSGFEEEAHGPANEVARALRQRMKDEIQAHAARQGITEGEARADLAYEDKERRKHEGESGARGREAGRIAEAMSGGEVGRKLLADGGMQEDELQKHVERAMEAAGMAAETIAELIPMVAKKLKEKVDKDVETRALNRGIDAKPARAQMSKQAEQEAREQRIKDAGTKLAPMSDKQYFDKLMIAGTQRAGLDMIPREALVEAKTHNRKLDQLIKLWNQKRPETIARFARRGRP